MVRVSMDTKLRGLIKWALILAILYLGIINPAWNGLLKFFQSEAKRCLESIIYAQDAYYKVNEEWTENLDDLILELSGSPKYAYFISTDDYYGRPLESMGLSMPVDFEALGAPDPGITDDYDFIAVAIGNIDLDSDLDVWCINNNYKLKNSKSDMFKLWNKISYHVKNILNL